MAGPGVGFEYPPRKVSWLKRDVLLFNFSVGCKADELHFLYELHDHFAAFPTFPLALIYKFASQDCNDFYAGLDSMKIPSVPNLDPRIMLDGQRTIQMLKPLPVTSAGQEFEFRTTVLGVYDKGKSGTVVRSEDALVDASSGEVFARIIGSLFYVHQGGWNGPRGPKEPSFPPPDGRHPDKTLTLRVANESAHLYRLNGDYNPLHATPEPGIQMGTGGIIMHGVYAYNCIAHDMLKELGHSDPVNMREFQAKFAGIVKPGDQVQTDLWRMGPDVNGWEEVRWTARVVNTGKVCLSDGRAMINVLDSQASDTI